MCVYELAWACIERQLWKDRMYTVESLEEDISLVLRASWGGEEKGCSGGRAVVFMGRGRSFHRGLHSHSP